MPRVTVVTPNYNHARYLPERIDSILAQTFQDFEFIILDDASTDKSREIIESYSKHEKVKAIFNQQNSGSTFRQWELGLGQAKGEYLWFAESDDYADRTLLEALVDRLDRHPNVGLAVCQSWTVDQDSKLLGNLEICWDMKITVHTGARTTSTRAMMNARTTCSGTTRSPTPVLCSGDVKSSNVSVGRRPHPRVCGDWVAYINVLQLSDIAFVSTPLNYFRQHRQNVRTQAVRQGYGIREYRRVQQMLIDRYGRGNLLRDHDKILPQFVNDLVNAARMPPHNKVPPAVSSLCRSCGGSPAFIPGRLRRP